MGRQPQPINEANQNLSQNKLNTTVMFSPTNLPTRRTFLERSALGAGSLLMAPLLSESCTDHNFPNPDTPWPETDAQINWNDTSKTVVVAGIGMIPEVGEILGGLVSIFWPSTKEDVWSQVRAQTEAIVNQKIADLVYLQVSEDLVGLSNLLTQYLNEVKNGTPIEILIQWSHVKDSFIEAQPHFQSKGNQVPLLGLFVQFANMYLSILRDGVISGQSWGRTDADHQQDIADLKNSIQDFYAYTTNTYNTGRTDVVNKTQRDDGKVEPFRSINAYDRQMAFTALDFRDSWLYMDVTQFPRGITDFLIREIYSDPFGTLKDSNNPTINIPKPGPAELPTQLTVWGYDRIDAVQLTYPANSGPGRATQTPRMGDQNGGSSQPPHGGSFNLSFQNPIVEARIAAGDIVNALQFKFQDGTTTNVLGGNAGGADVPNRLSYANEVISSIYIPGIFYYYGSAGCIVFGFRFLPSLTSTLRTISSLYITSPKERSVADFTQAFPKLAIPSNLITNELKAAREAHWAYIAAQVKGPK